MADWTDPPYSALTVDKAWTDEKATAAFENVVALAEGAPGAPRIVVTSLAPGGRALARITGGGVTWVAITSLDDVGELDGWLYATQTAGAGGALEFALSDNAGASWAATATVHTEGSAWTSQGLFNVNLVTGEASWILGSPVTATLPAGSVNAIRIRVSSTGSFIYQPRAVAGKS